MFFAGHFQEMICYIVHKNTSSFDACCEDVEGLFEHYTKLAKCVFDLIMDSFDMSSQNFDVYIRNYILDICDAF